MTPDEWPISALAREFDVTQRTIRYYEAQGLLNPERRSGRRIYGKTDRIRLKLALRGKRLGLSLAEIRELLGLYDGLHDSPAQIARFLEMLAERRHKLEQQRQDLDAVLAEIEQFEHSCQTLLAAKTS